MTLENFLSQMGIGSKPLIERYAEYPAQTHDHLYYAYEPPISSHEHVSSLKHHYSGGHKSNAAMSALTLLAFLFFLHILQQCLKEHMMAMSTPQVMVVSAGRDGDGQSVAKLINKLDKGGVANEAKTANSTPTDFETKNKIQIENNAAFMNNDEEIFLMKIQTAEHTPYKMPDYKSKLRNYGNSSSIFTSNYGH